MRTPERLRYLILLTGGDLIGDCRCGPMLKAAAAIEPPQAIERAGQAEAEERHRRNRNEDNQHEQRNGTPKRRQHQPQAGP